MPATVSNSPEPSSGLKNNFDDDLEESPPFDLLLVPVLGRFLKWRHSRTVLGIPLLAVSLVMILHGLLGPSLSPKNLATVLTWVHFRGALVLAILCAGNLFCLACPFMLVRNFMRNGFIRALPGRDACVTSGFQSLFALFCSRICSASGLRRGSRRGSSSDIFCRPDRRRPLHPRNILQICLPHRPVQFHRLDRIAA